MNTDTPRQLLRRVFGFEDFRGPQREIVEHVVAGGDALVLMPTGGGKSLCYQVPALLRPGCAIVVSPLIALMQDQVAALTQLSPASSTRFLAEAIIVSEGQAANTARGLLTSIARIAASAARSAKVTGVASAFISSPNADRK